MNKGMDARLDRLEGATAERPLAIVWVDGGREDEAEAARLEAMGFRVLCVGWLASE